jgi:hypothetical protein
MRRVKKSPPEPTLNVSKALRDLMMKNDKKKLKIETDEEDEEHDSSEDQPQQGGPAQSTSIAVASPEGPVEQEQDSRESYTPPENNSVPLRDEEQEADNEEEAISPAKKKGSKGKETGGSGVTYFPINFGGNPGVVAIANSYSTGKGEPI